VSVYVHRCNSQRTIRRENGWPSVINETAFNTKKFIALKAQEIPVSSFIDGCHWEVSISAIATFKSAGFKSDELAGV
jgi:hypothetical protein